MKKLVLLTTVFIAGSANAGLLDGLSNILGKTGNVLNTVTGVPNTTKGIQTSSTSKANLIRIPDKETSEYKFENVTIDLGSMSVGNPVALLTGVFYNKTDKPMLRVTMTIPMHDSQGFEMPSINYTAAASAHEKTRINALENTLREDSKPDIDKIKYLRLKY